MSLGTNSNIASFHEAVQRVHQAGIVQIAAGGNDGPGPDTVDYPAAYPEVIAVAAVDSNDQVPSWSSRGSEINLAAPGVNINSTYKGGGYQTKQGTSMATPHVVGVAALRLENHSGETPDSLRNLLEAEAETLAFGSTLVGTGLVDALGVVFAP
jgi:subtilisin family serine protease